MSRYETHSMKDPRLPFILHDTHVSHGRVEQIGNWHENVEILYFTGGNGLVTSNELRIPVSTGDIVVLNTNCIHTISCDATLDYYCLIVDRSFCLANHFDTNQISFDVHLRDGELAALFEELAKEWGAEEDAYRVQTIRALVLRIMAILCRRYSHPEAEPSADSRLLSCIKQAIGFIHAESHRDLSLDEIARQVGLSKFYFAREFRNVTGYTVVSYINIIRCERAKRMLAENRLAVGEVGRACGFTNQSYFTRTFFSITGEKPSEYRKKSLNKQGNL